MPDGENAASVAELADALGLGPSVLWDVEVRVLSLALWWGFPVAWSAQWLRHEGISREGQEC